VCNGHVTIATGVLLHAISATQLPDNGLTPDNGLQTLPTLPALPKKAIDHVTTMLWLPPTVLWRCI
jgi:hypothetical protein